jgi:hypothetical protein
MMHKGGVPGAIVTRKLLDRIEDEWRDKTSGREAAIERAARLAAVVKGLGYKGIHIGGIHKRFDTVGRILDRFEAVSEQWRIFCRNLIILRKAAFMSLRMRAKSRMLLPALVNGLSVWAFWNAFTTDSTKSSMIFFSIPTAAWRPCWKRPRLHWIRRKENMHS